jgi:hypothetical protein
VTQLMMMKGDVLWIWNLKSVHGIQL